jgi:cold shock CspA family protein
MLVRQQRVCFVVERADKGCSALYLDVQKIS